MKLTPDVRALLDEPNFAHLATLLPDGSPQSAPVWIDVEGDRVLIATGEGSLKARNTKRDARVSLSVVAMDNPYREAQQRALALGQLVIEQIRNVLLQITKLGAKAGLGSFLTRVGVADVRQVQ